MAVGIPSSIVTSLELATTDELERGFIRALCSVYPSQIKAYEIMRRIGLAEPSRRDYLGAACARSHSNIVKFHNLRIRVSQLLISFGWQVERTGGLVTDAYRVVFKGHREAA